MSVRPIRKIKPTAKLAEDNAGDLELTSHRRAHAAASANAAPSPASPSPDPSTDFYVESSPDGPDPPPYRTSTKRPHALRNSLTLSDGDFSDVPDAAPSAKKAKPTTKSAAGPPSDVSIISIDDVDNPQDEPLNKSDPTADIRNFFSDVPRAPGQDKDRMQCKLCE